VLFRSRTLAVRIFQADAEQSVGHIGGFLISRCFGISGTGDYGESFRKEITAHTDGMSGLIHMKVHLSVTCEAIISQEFITQASTFQPFLPRFDSIVQGRYKPTGSSLYPHGFVGVDQASVSIPHQQVASVLFVV